MSAVPTRLLLLTVFAVTACSRDATSDTAATSSATATPAAAPAASAAAEPTANDISNYPLDMDKMRRYAGAIKGFSTMSKTDSSVLSAMSSGSANESTAQMISRIESSPIAMKVLNDNRLSAKDYVWITAAYIQAAMTQGLIESSPQAKVPEGQNTRNIEFLKANKTELEKIMKDAGMTQ